MTNRIIVPVIEAEKLSFDAFDIQELKRCSGSLLNM